MTQNTEPNNHKSKAQHIRSGQSANPSTPPSLQQYMYTYACHEDEVELCSLELRRLLQATPAERYVCSGTYIDLKRSPFIHHRLDIILEVDTLAQLESEVKQLHLGAYRKTLIHDGDTLSASTQVQFRTAYKDTTEPIHDVTFKLVCLDADQTFTYEEKRSVERRIGMNVKGKAQMKQPEVWLGMAFVNGKWVLGRLWHSESVWLQHNNKPRHYSTALSTRVARAIVNIALPQPTERTLLDPCCGIGTVLIEALSMGMNVSGSDLNPLAVQGARENLLFYHMPDIVRIADMRELDGHYDAIVLDLPYNLCSVLEEDERLDMLRATGRLASLQVIIATEPLEASLLAAGLQISETCRIRKGKFTRYVWLCELG